MRNIPPNRDGPKARQRFNVLVFEAALMSRPPVVDAADIVTGTLIVEGRSFGLRHGDAVEHRALPSEIAEGSPEREISIVLKNRPPTPAETLSGAPSGVRGVQLAIDPSTGRLIYGIILAPGQLDPLDENSPIAISFEEKDGYIRGSAATTDLLRPGSGLEVEFAVKFTIRFEPARVLRTLFEGDAARASEPARVLVKFFTAAWRSDAEELETLITDGYWRQGSLPAGNLQELRESLFPRGVDLTLLERSIARVYEYDDIAAVIIGPLPDEWGREGWGFETLSRQDGKWKVGPPADQP